MTCAGCVNGIEVGDRFMTDDLERVMGREVPDGLPDSWTGGSGRREGLRPVRGLHAGRRAWGLETNYGDEE
jgi:hypothetical protein